MGDRGKGSSNVVQFPGGEGPGNEALRCLQRLVTEARAAPGEPRLIGIAYIVLYSNDEHAADVVGEAREAPTFARGLLCELDDQLAQLMRAQRIG